jgi:hypothetical protein
LSEAIKDITVKSKDSEVDINLNDGWLRIFHPKALAHKAIRDAFFDTMKSQRDFSKKNEPQPPPPPPLEPPKGPTKALSIGTEWVTGAPTLDWQFFATDYGKKVECRSDWALRETRKIAPKGSTMHRGGSFNLKLFDQNCQYKNSGDNTGKLYCGDKTIDCVDDPAYKDPSSPTADKGNYKCGNRWRQPVFTCAY